MNRRALLAVLASGTVGAAVLLSGGGGIGGSGGDLASRALTRTGPGAPRFTPPLTGGAAGAVSTGAGADLATSRLLADGEVRFARGATGGGGRGSMRSPLTEHGSAATRPVARLDRSVAPPLGGDTAAPPSVTPGDEPAQTPPGSGSQAGGGQGGGGGGAGQGGGTGSGTPTRPPREQEPPPVDATEREILHQARLIERITFGPTPALVDEVSRIGAAAFLEQQLSLPAHGPTGVLDIEPNYLGMPNGFVYEHRDGRNHIAELRHAAVLRAMHHPGQLAEMMTDFWHNHFPVFAGSDDLQVGYCLMRDDQAVIRANALGKFSTMLIESARSLSMLRYLDNFRSTANNPNQNYAREVMELHTLGEGNGYDEDDVAAVSFILSGWSLEGRIQDPPGFVSVFRPERHNTAPQRVDITLPDGRVAVWETPGRSGQAGFQDGVDFLDWLARLPNTARYLSEKIARRFIDDVPPRSVVERMAQAYLANDTDIAPVLRTLFTSDEFVMAPRRKVKTPFQFFVGMLRALDADVAREPGTASTRIQESTSGLGQQLFGWPTPDGFPDDRNYWITTNTVMRRWELAARLCNDRLSGLAVDVEALLPDPMPATVGELVWALAERLCTPIDETIVSIVSEHLGATHDAPVSAVRLDRHLGSAVALLFCAPTYQFR